MPEHTDQGTDEGDGPPPSDDDLLSYFETGRPFRTASEVASRFRVDQSTARRRLSRLAHESRLREVTLDEQTVVWWRDREVANEKQTGTDDPLFDAPAFTADEPIDEAEIDDILYEDTEP